MSARATEPPFDVAYLGPEGSFAHLVAEKRYPDRRLLPFPSVHDAFAFLETHPDDRAILPIENSSGGPILPTVDGLIERAGEVFIHGELSLDVKLALIGRKQEGVELIFSHFAPLYHCEPFLRKQYPAARTIPCESTTAAAQRAAETPRAAAIGALGAAERYGLDILVYPIQENVPNVTQFFVLGRARPDPALGEKTSLVLALPNTPGSLCDFLKPFAEAQINLTRIESRPVRGQPNTYRFLVELSGTETDPAVRGALDGARLIATRFHNIGAYPVLPRYQS